MKKHPVDGAYARARTLRQNITEAERRLWQILRSHQMKGYKFRRQVPIGRYIADFVCHEARLIVEVDGGQHDRSSPREAERGVFLENEGYRILRFWNNEVLANLAGVQETIADELSRITPTHPRANGRENRLRPSFGRLALEFTRGLPHQGGGIL